MIVVLGYSIGHWQENVTEDTTFVFKTSFKTFLKIVRIKILPNFSKNVFCLNVNFLKIKSEYFSFNYAFY